MATISAGVEWISTLKFVCCLHLNFFNTGPWVLRDAIWQILDRGAQLGNAGGGKLWELVGCGNNVKWDRGGNQRIQVEEPPMRAWKRGNGTVKKLKTRRIKGKERHGKQEKKE